MLIEKVYAAGSIDNAPTLSEVLENVLDFLLQVVGIVGIIGMVAAGMMYFFAAGNPKQINVAKRIVVGIIVGMVIMFGAVVILKTILGFFQ